MMKRTLTAITCAALAQLAMACGDTGTSGTSTSSSSGGASGSSSSSGGGGTCAITGAVAPDPSMNAVVAGGGTPDFSCYSTPVMLTAPTTIIAKGCVDIFGLGRTVKQGMKLSIYAIDQNPGPGMDMPQYGTVDIILDPASGCESNGRYRITGVPSNTPLIFKTFDTDTGANKTAVDTYQWNVVLRADRHDVDGDGEYEFPANMIFAQTYTTIPSVVARPIEGQTNLSDYVGKGAIAGEIRDCNEASVGFAAVGASCVDQLARLVYFNGAADPQPVITRTDTNSDGLYAIVNVRSMTAGAGGTSTMGHQHEIEAKVKTAEGIFTAGKAQVWVYPDSITVYSPQGMLPTVP